MRILQAGKQQLISLEPEHDIIENLVAQAGYECSLEETEQLIVVEVKPASATDPILLFDAADSANHAWFSRCQFYVNAVSGAVLQTPLTIATCRDAEGQPLRRLRIALSKELPASFRLPGDQTVSEQVVYAILYRLLVALRETGVAICGKGGVEALAGAGTGRRRKR